jgi:hypothetical protein
MTDVGIDVGIDEGIEGGIEGWGNGITQENFWQNFVLS